jgi:hypothetical protein
MGGALAGSLVDIFWLSTKPAPQPDETCWRSAAFTSSFSVLPDVRVGPKGGTIGLAGTF